jgi:hypothetical protein
LNAITDPGNTVRFMDDACSLLTIAARHDLAAHDPSRQPFGVAP